MRIAYGKLVLLGYNGALPGRGNTCRKKSKFTLYQRKEANGIKGRLKSANLSVQQIEFQRCECEKDMDTDMFQIGRSAESSNDFVILVKKDKTRTCIPRFSFRILANRDDPSVCKVSAGGFNSSGIMALGGNGFQCKVNDTIDAVPSNGVLMMKPEGIFSAGTAKFTTWLQVSVNGEMYARSSYRGIHEQLVQVENATNELNDGALIDVCGATLLWRTTEGILESKMTKDVLISENLKLKQNPTKIFLSCGHIETFQGTIGNLETCVVCKQVGPVVQLQVGMEPLMYVDLAPISYVFNSCGHMATKKTVIYWANLPFVHKANSFIAKCPFCNSALNGSPGYVEIKGK